MGLNPVRGCPYRKREIRTDTPHGSRQGHSERRWLCGAGGRDWGDVAPHGAPEAGTGRRDPPLEPLEGAARRTPWVGTSSPCSTERTALCSLKAPACGVWWQELWEPDAESAGGQRWGAVGRETLATSIFCYNLAVTFDSCCDGIGRPLRGEGTRSWAFT